MNAPPFAIDVTNLNYHYGQVHALRDLTLQVPPGQVVGLFGENGCGKTTLLKVLAGLLNRYEGDVTIAGHVPGAASKAAVAFLPDADFLPANATIPSLLKYYADFYPDFRPDQAMETLSWLGLAHYKYLREMSKGMREKVQVAMLMARDASVFLLDEPISGVDPLSRDVVLSMILDRVAPESTVIISSHLIHDLEPIVNWMVLMRHGSILVNDDTDNLRGRFGASLNTIFKEVYR